MSIPFQGYNRYVCHICNKSFEFPNPLKVHIALKCDRRNISHLWFKLANEFSSMMRPHNTRTVTAPANGCSRAVRTETTINNLERSSQGYSCDHCGKVFKEKYYLTIHLRLISHFIFSVIELVHQDGYFLLKVTSFFYFITTFSNND
jgi:DNA-directed RNA polymerase subunit RPC12/RpoP